MLRPTTTATPSVLARAQLKTLINTSVTTKIVSIRALSTTRTTQKPLNRLRIPSLSPAFLSSPAYRAMSSTSTSTSDPLVLTETRGPIRILTLNRPKALNALSSPLFVELNAHLLDAQADDSIRAIVLTGGKKVWAAGADIKEMKDKTFEQVYRSSFLNTWDEVLVGKVKKPIIGAVNGYALGGGCELAMMCDILIAAPTATFGQPEINLGIIPGAGGTQRLTKIVGKAIAMDMVLTGRMMKADEAHRLGLVSRLVKEGEDAIEEAIKVAEVIASKGAISVQAGKEAVNASDELSLVEGLRLEKRLFHQLFATQDQKEGMAAFAEKRKPNFSHL